MTRTNKLDKATEARRIARERIGKVPGKRVIPDKRNRPPKHKKSLGGDE